MQKTSTNAVIILHNIRSVYNVGGIFRTADAIGIDHIYLTGYTPTPLDRFGRWRNDLAKSALGAEKTVPWTTVENINELITELKSDGFQVIAVEQDEQSVDYKTISSDGRLAFILGNEVDGIESEVLDQVDTIAEIPMLGEKESLNVMVSAGIALYRILDI